MWYASRALFVASTVLAVLTVNTAKAQNGHDEETVTNLLAKERETADQPKELQPDRPTSCNFLP